MHARLLAVLFLVTVPSAKAQDIETCRLIQKADVTSAVGRSVPDGRKDAGKMGDIVFSHCSYMEGNRVLVLATVYTYQLGKEELQKQFETAKQQAGDAETVSGLGDEAYWWKSKTTLLVLKDTYMVTVLMGSSVGRLDAAKTLAAKIVKGLPGA